MSTVKMPWFRMYTDFLNDPKMIALAFEDQRHFIGILALKSDGALEADVEESLMDRIVAQRLWIDHGIIRDVKKRLVAAGLINANWQPLAWDKRQFKSDSSKDRVAKFRASKKDGNGDVTLPKRKSNAVDTDTDTDTETEKDNAGKPAMPSGFSEFWKAWPPSERKQAKGKCLDAWKKANAEQDVAAVLTHVERMKASPGWTKQSGEFIPSPLVYLHQRRWEGADDDGGTGSGFASSAVGVFV